MKLIVLGTAGYHPNEARHTTCVMIPEAGIIFDAGTSFFRVPAHLQTESVDIFLSHTHLDHVVGLTYLLDVLQQKPLKHVRVHGEAAKLTAIRTHLFSPDLFPVEPPYEECPLGDTVEVASAHVSHFPLQHPGGSVGYRVDWPGRSMAFVTDTTATPRSDYIERVRGVDVLVHECNFVDGEEALAMRTGHSCLTPVCRLAREADVGKLVLLHFNPLGDEITTEALAKAEREFSPIIVASDGLAIEF